MIVMMMMMERVVPRMIRSKVIGKILALLLFCHGTTASASDQHGYVACSFCIVAEPQGRSYTELSALCIAWSDKEYSRPRQLRGGHVEMHVTMRYTRN